MYIKIGETIYREIRNLSFAPEIDIVGDSLPVNEMSVDVKTYDSIEAGSWVSLYDDLDQRWCMFWIKYADVIDDGFIHIDSMSVVGLLDRYTLPAAVYTSAEGAYGLISQCFKPLKDAGLAWFVVDLAVMSAEIKGYLPEQTARERLQWICFAIQAYVKQAFTDPYKLDGSDDDAGSVEIRMINTETVTSIPIERTYWKPSITYKDYVTSITMKAYGFRRATPADGDEYVEVDGVTYVKTETDFTLDNPDVPEDVPPNVLSVDDVTIVHNGNVSAIMSRLAMLYFARLEVDADVVNNKEYQPTQRVDVFLDDGRDATGYIQETDFSFGVQAKSKLKLVGMQESDLRQLGSLLIKYMYQGANVASKRYDFPEGYSYQVENQFIDKSSGKHRYIFRPVNKYATGTMTTGRNVNEQVVKVALHWYSDEKLLHIISVSDMEYDTEDKVLTIE